MIEGLFEKKFSEELDKLILRTKEESVYNINNCSINNEHEKAIFKEGHYRGRLHILKEIKLILSLVEEEL